MNKRIQMLYYVAFDTAPTKDWHLMIEVFVLPLRFSTIGRTRSNTERSSKAGSIRLVGGGTA